MKTYESFKKILVGFNPSITFYEVYAFTVQNYSEDRLKHKNRDYFSIRVTLELF